MQSIAWMLRSDGQAFPVVQHLYGMDDDDLSSEAEVAAFLVKTSSKDIELAYDVLDIWMALLIENSVSYNASSTDIDNAILKRLDEVPYKFMYPLSVDEFLDIHHSLGHYNDIDSLYDFIDNSISKLGYYQSAIKESLNQQFCRVRYGGKYNSSDGESAIWFRVSSVGYNWANVIYEFTAAIYHKYHIEYITICRDHESDNGYDSTKPEYFYKAKDGTIYYNMPIDEYLVEEHEHNPVFSATQLGAGVLRSIQVELNKGNTLYGINKVLAAHSIPTRYNLHSYLLNKELSTSWVEASEWFDNLPTRTMRKIGKLKQMILAKYPEIASVDVDCEACENNSGKMIGFRMTFNLESNIEALDHLPVTIKSTKPVSDVQLESIFRMFRIEYEDYKKFMKI